MKQIPSTLGSLILSKLLVLLACSKNCTSTWYPGPPTTTAYPLK